MGMRGSAAVVILVLGLVGGAQGAGGPAVPGSEPRQAADGQWHSWTGLAGYGIAGIGGDTPREQYYLRLDDPIEVDGAPWYTLMAEMELPVGERLTLCGRVELRTFRGAELQYRYPALVEVASHQACR
jgi:hypothetical protein